MSRICRELLLALAGASFAQTLEGAAAALESQETVSVREMLNMMGEQGLLLLCMVLMLPFLLPVFALVSLLFFR